MLKRLRSLTLCLVERGNRRSGNRQVRKEEKYIRNRVEIFVVWFKRNRVEQKLRLFSLKERKGKKLDNQEIYHFSDFTFTYVVIIFDL